MNAATARCPHCSCELDLVPRGTLPPVPPANEHASTETLDEWMARWWREDRARRVSRPEDERRTYEIWIQPRLGSLPITAIQREHIESLVEHLDESVLAETIAWATATRVWGLVSKCLKDACGSKIRALRVRSDNPAQGVRGPDRGSSRASTFLYPSEFLALAECAEIPLEFRRLYAVTIYLYPRAGEVRALRWSDIDQATGRVHIHSSADRRGQVGRTKSEADRQFVAETALMPLLDAMRREAGDVPGAKVLPYIPQRQNLARALRQHLYEADCRREDLFANDRGRRPLTYHDLRATGITWQAMRGDSPTDILERVGHANLSTTQKYMRRGRLLASASGEVVFPEIPAALL